jgi:hypothetical protein
MQRHARITFPDVSQTVNVQVTYTCCVLYKMQDKLGYLNIEVLCDVTICHCVTSYRRFEIKQILACLTVTMKAYGPSKRRYLRASCTA